MPRSQSANTGRKAREALVRRALIAEHGGMQVLLQEMADAGTADLLQSPKQQLSPSPISAATRRQLRRSPHRGAPWALGAEYTRLEAELASLQAQMAAEKAEKVLCLKSTLHPNANPVW